MQSNDEITSIRKVLKNNDSITEDEYVNIINIFCKNTFGYNIELLYKHFENSRYDYYIPEKLLMRCYKNQSHSKALSLLSEDMQSDKKTYEWGILFHANGIWLLNRDIKTSNTDFGSKKIVFRILFTNKTDYKYFSYFNHKYLMGYDKDIYFFRDIITYKNIQFPSTKSNSWDAYFSCIKRFINYYIKERGHYIEDTEQCYKNITLADYESYIKINGTIKTPNTAKNQFFYIKSFILSQTYNKEFDISSNEILDRCRNILNKSKENENETDIKKIAYIIRHIESQRNGKRNKVIFLILLCFGLERRKICALTWNDIDKNCKKIKIGNYQMTMPHILQEGFKELLQEKKDDAIYIFGNVRTNWQKPLPESGINGVLECIKNLDTKDEFYQKFSPGNIRKWLFRFLLKENPLQDVLVLMNIPICNISNYISDEEMIEFTTYKLSKGEKYLLEDFMNDVEKLL
jgi:integrase